LFRVFVAEKEVLELFCNYQCFQYFPILNLHRVTHRVTTFLMLKIIQRKISVLVREKQIFESKTQFFYFRFNSIVWILFHKKSNKLYVKTCNFN
jgi:hypothetical protein